MQARQHQAPSLPYCQLSEKCTLDVKKGGYSQIKRVECNDSVSIAKLSSSTASTQPLPPAGNRTQVEGDAADKFMNPVTISDSESSVTVKSQ